MTEINVRVKRTVKVAIDASHETEDGTKIRAVSQAKGIKIEIKKYGQYYADSLVIPDELLEPLGDVFAAVRQARIEADAETGSEES